jgi:hypothetical protein
MELRQDGSIQRSVGELVLYFILICASVPGSIVLFLMALDDGDGNHLYHVNICVYKITSSIVGAVSKFFNYDITIWRKRPKGGDK